MAIVRSFALSQFIRICFLTHLTPLPVTNWLINAVIILFEPLVVRAPSSTGRSWVVCTVAVTDGSCVFTQNVNCTLKMNFYSILCNRQRSISAFFFSFFLSCSFSRTLGSLDPTAHQFIVRIKSNAWKIAWNVNGYVHRTQDTSSCHS